MKKQIFVPSQAGSVVKEIGQRISEKKKLSEKDRTKLASNFDKICRRAKSEGISMSQLASNAHLGQGEAKELYRFRLPEGSLRSLHRSAEKWVTLVEVLANIEGHSRSRQPALLLKEAFRGTSYLEATDSMDDITDDFYELILECNDWLTRDDRLEKAFKVVDRYAGSEPDHLDGDDYAEQIYHATARYHDVVGMEGVSSYPQISLGVHCDQIFDRLGREVPLLRSDGEEGSLFHRTEMFLYCGPDNDRRIKLQLVIEHSLVARFVGDERLVEVDMITDQGDPELMDLEVDLCSRSNAVISHEFVSEALDLDFAQVWSEEQIDIKPGDWALEFQWQNPDIDRYGFGGGMAAIPRNYQISPLTYDVLEWLGNELDRRKYQGGEVFLNLPWPDRELNFKYGNSTLKGVLAKFLHPSIHNSWDWMGTRSELVATFQTSQFNLELQPSSGWLSGNDHSRWSIPDLLWMATRLFCKWVEVVNEADQKKEGLAQENLIKKMRSNRMSEA